MKTILCLLAVLSFGMVHAQSIVGTWQQTDKKTCFDAQIKESDTEKELLPMMGSDSQTSVAKLISFDAKGRGEEAIFSEGSKKGTSKNAFTYKVNGQQLILTDKKSGIITQQFVIDELSESTLRVHDAKQDCETRAFSKVK
jgi:Lipocalin-like domain